MTLAFGAGVFKKPCESFSQTANRQSRKLFRTLRQVRRILSDCRNVDVTLALIEDKFNSATASTLMHHGS